MEVSTFFARLLHAPKPAAELRAPDDLADFDAAWIQLKVGNCWERKERRSRAEYPQFW